MKREYAFLFVFAVITSMFTLTHDSLLAAEKGNINDNTVTISRSRYDSLILMEDKLNNIKELIDEKLVRYDERTKSLQYQAYVLYIILAAFLAFFGYIFSVFTKYFVKKEIDPALKKLIKRIDDREAVLTKSSENILGLTDELVSFKEKASNQFNRALANVYRILAVSYYLQNMYRVAIIYINHALTFANKLQRAGDKEAKDFLNELISVRSYYWACAQDEDKRVEALKNCDITLSIIRETGKLSHVDTYLYVLMHYGRTREEKRKWIDIYEEYKESLDEDLSAVERYKNRVEVYRKHYEKLKIEI